MGSAFLWGAFAASSLLIGAVIVGIHETSSRSLGLIMGFGAGVLMSAVSFELVEEAANTGSGPAWVALGLLSGTLVYFLGDRSLERMSKSEGGGDSGIGIVLGAILDGIPESAVLGLTLLTTGEIGLSMLVAVFISNIPEGIAGSSGLISDGWSTTKVITLWLIVMLASGFSSAAGYGFLDTAGTAVVAFVLSFAAGAILCMLSSTMIPEAYERASRSVGLVVPLGFAVAFFTDWFQK